MRGRSVVRAQLNRLNVTSADQAPAREDERDHRPREDAFAAAGRREPHQISLRRVDRQRERGQSVGGEVDVQDLDGAQRERLAEERSADEEPDLAQVRREQVHQVLLDVAKDASALLHGGDDRGEVVVGERHRGRLFRHIRAGNAHRDADVSLLERRSVVDAVAGHRDRVAVLLERADDAQLVRRRHARVNLDLLDLLLELGVPHPLELRAGDGPPGGEDAELAGDGPGSEGMVAGDHHRPDAGALARQHGLLCLGPRWIADPDEAEEGQTALRILEARIRSAGEGEDAQRLVRQLACGRRDLLAPVSVELRLARRREETGAGAEDHLGRALRIRDRAVGRLVQRCHALALGGERNLAGPGELGHEVG